MSRHAIILVELDDDGRWCRGTPVGLGSRIDVTSQGATLGSGFVRRVFCPQPVENHTDFEVGGVDTDVKYDANNPDWGPYDVRLTIRAPQPTDEPADDIAPIEESKDEGPADEGPKVH